VVTAESEPVADAEDRLNDRWVGRIRFDLATEVADVAVDGAR
jgi:hypothetical protein